MGAGVITVNFKNVGVSRYRLWASAKNGNTSSTGRGSQIFESSVCIFILLEDYFRTRNSAAIP